ncbi:MAG: RsmE family RNA methyltransferase [Candidatus Omnitrophota bacterium]
MQSARVSSKNIREGIVTISAKEEAHHLKNVLRIKLKEKVLVFDELGRQYLCLVEKLEPELILIVKEELKNKASGSQASLTIGCAIPKKSNMDDIIDKLTQLGVNRIIPLETERVIVKLDQAKKKMRLERWKKIALNAAGQSQRGELPEITPIKGIKQVLEESGKFDLRLIPHLFGQRKSLKQVISTSNAKNILVLIGPEGDFTPEEIKLALKAGFIPLSLGDLVLRVETAALAVASFIRFYAEND